MSESKHTPGPWKAKQDKYNDWDIFSEKPGDGAHFLYIDAIPTKYDAHLVAAAPELLEACEMMLEAPNTGPPLSWMRAAVKKARGE